MNLQHLAKAVRINDDMLCRRDFVRSVMTPERYRQAVANVQRIIRAVMARDGLEPLPATLKLCQQAMLDGHGSAVTMLIAGVVEMVEGDAKEHHA